MQCYVLTVCVFFKPGIVHKGNGENLFISQQPSVIASVMGNGHQRSVPCTTCNGPSHTSKLFAPVALASGTDGSLYVGDFNFVRRLLPSGNSISILELRYENLECLQNVMRKNKLVERDLFSGLNWSSVLFLLGTPLISDPSLHHLGCGGSRKK